MPIELSVVEQILGANDRIAAENRKLLHEHRVLVAGLCSALRRRGAAG